MQKAGSEGPPWRGILFSEKQKSLAERGATLLPWRLLCGRSGDGFDGDGAEGCAVVEVDVFHRVVGVVVAAAVDVVVLHEQNDRDASVGEDLGVGVVERAAGIDHSPDLAAKFQEWSDLGDRRAVRTATPAGTAGPVGLGVPLRHRGVPNLAGDVSLFGKPERGRAGPR